jgi:hypothetical protein
MPTLLLQNIFTLVCLKEIVDGLLVVGAWKLDIGCWNLLFEFEFSLLAQRSQSVSQRNKMSRTLVYLLR